MIPCFFLNFHLWSSQRKEPDGISLELLIWKLFWHLYVANLSPPWSICTPNTHAHRTGVKIIPNVASPMGFLLLWWPKMKIQEKTRNHDNTKVIPIHEPLWMPRTCGLIHPFPLLNYPGDHQCHGYCMILWCWGCPNGRTDPECPVHVRSPTPCLIILVLINPMNIMVPKVSWWMNVQYVWIHPPLD